MPRIPVRPIRPIRPVRPIPGSNTSSSANNSVVCDTIEAQLASVTTDLDAALLNTSLYKSSETKKSGTDFIVNSNGCYQLTLTNKTSSEKMYIKSAGRGNIYPGAILFVGNELTSGNPVPLTGIDRAPIKVFGKFFGDNSTSATCKPTNNDVHNAVNKIVKEICGTKYEAAQNIEYSKNIYDSKAQMTFKMGVDASFCGANVNVGFNSDGKEEKFVQDQSIYQEFFTVVLDDEYKNNLSSLFASSVTPKQLADKMMGRHMCIVTSVTYGRDVHYLREYNLKSMKIESTQKTKGVPYVNIDCKEDITKSCASTNEQLVAIGCNSSLSASILRGKRSDAEIDAALADTMKFSASNQGDIVGYTLAVITGPNAGMTITPKYEVDYVEKEYKRCPGRVLLQIKMETWTFAGQENVKVKFTYDTFKLDGNNNKVVSRRGVQDEKAYDDSSAYDIRALNLLPGEYVEGGVARLQVRCRPCKGADWHNDIENVLIDMSSGIVDLHLIGTTRAGSGSKSYIAGDSVTKIKG